MAWRRERSGLARIIREEFMAKVTWELELERQVKFQKGERRVLSDRNQHAEARRHRPDGVGNMSRSLWLEWWPGAKMHSFTDSSFLSLINIY